MSFHRVFSILFQTRRDILDSMINIVLFPKNFHSVFNRKVRETYCCFCSIACEEKRAHYIIRIFTLNNKNRLNLPLPLDTRSFWESQALRSARISQKRSCSPQTLRIVNVSTKKASPNPLFVIHCLDNHKIWRNQVKK